MQRLGRTLTVESLSLPPESTFATLPGKKRKTAPTFFG